MTDQEPCGAAPAPRSPALHAAGMVRVGERGTWRRVEAEWRDVVLVCRRCGKRGGFGPDGGDTLARALRRSLDGGERRKAKARRREIGVVEVGCLDVCPRHAVVVVKGSDPRSMILVPKGTEMAEVMERLGLRTGGDEGLGA